MVKRKYQAKDDQLFDTQAEAEAHEAVIDNRREWLAQLDKLGFDEPNAERILDNAWAIYELLDGDFGRVHQDERDE